MSMNLTFRKNTGNRVWVDFSYQTPTALSHKIVNASSKEGRLLILREYLEGQRYEKETVDRLVNELKSFLDDPDWEVCAA